MEKIKTSTIGFTKSTAKAFFGRLISSGVKVLYDVRLNNTSQLSGFAKSDDLAFFLDKIAGVRYEHQPILAPTSEMLKSYRSKKRTWDEYQREYIDLLSARKIEERLSPNSFSDTCLLCSESTPYQCHRRLICEYLNHKWNGVLDVKHL